MCAISVLAGAVRPRGSDRRSSTPRPMPAVPGLSGPRRRADARRANAGRTVRDVPAQPIKPKRGGAGTRSGLTMRESRICFNDVLQSPLAVLEAHGYGPRHASSTTRCVFCGYFLGRHIAVLPGDVTVDTVCDGVGYIECEPCDSTCGTWRHHAGDLRVARTGGVRQLPHPARRSFRTPHTTWAATQLLPTSRAPQIPRFAPRPTTPLSHRRCWW